MLITMHNNSKGGFTLIEVVLVLGIGSLIFAMAFIAYGQASINRRDTQRRADLGKIASELENYAADNNGNYPERASFSTATYESDFVPNYIATLKDPTGTKYTDITSEQPGYLKYFPQRFGDKYDPQKMCDGVTDLPAGTKDYVVRMMLEKGEICRDSAQ